MFIGLLLLDNISEDKKPLKELKSVVEKYLSL